MLQYVSVAVTLSFTSSGSFSEIEVPSTNNISVNSIVSKISGDGILSPDTTVISIDSINNIITLSSQPLSSGNVVLSFIKPYGTPTVDFEFEINSVGTVGEVVISDGGNGYSDGDILSINSVDLSQPITKIVTNKTLQLITFQEIISSTYFSVGDFIVYSAAGASIEGEIYQVNISGSNLVSLLIDNISVSPSNTVTKQGQFTSFTINSADNKFRFFIDNLLSPNLTLYVGDIYNFDISDSSNTEHIFSLSEFEGGIWSPSYIDGVTATLSTTSKEFVVSNPANIVVGISVESVSGFGIVSSNTRVVSINGSTITVDNFPISSGLSDLVFRGTEYLDGVEKTSTSLKLKVTENTPNLYYYCATNNSSHEHEGGDLNNESLITINPINPRVFGSGFSLLVDQVDSSDIISFNVSTGKTVSESFEGETAVIDDITSLLIQSDNIETQSLSVNTISSSSPDISITPSLNVSGNLNIGTGIQIQSSTGNITTSGILRTNN